MPVKKHLKLKEVDTRKLRQGWDWTKLSSGSGLRSLKAVVRVMKAGARCLAQFEGYPALYTWKRSCSESSLGKSQTGSEHTQRAQINHCPSEL